MVFKKRPDMVIAANRHPYQALFIEFIIGQGIHDRKAIDLRFQKLHGIQVCGNMFLARFVGNMEIAAILQLMGADKVHEARQESFQKFPVFVTRRIGIPAEYLPAALFFPICRRAFPGHDLRGMSGSHWVNK